MPKHISLEIEGEPHEALWLAEERPHLGSAMEVENRITKLKGYIGEAPIAINSEAVAPSLGLESAPWVEAIEREGTRSIFVGVSFGIEHRAGFSPSAVGIELLFRDDDRNLNGMQNIHVHSLFPAPEYRVIGGAKLEADAEVSAGGKFSASLDPPGVLQAAVEDGEIDKSVDLGAGAKASASATVGGNIKLATEIRTPLVSAMGVGDHRAWWCFHRAAQELTGEDIVTWTGLALSASRRRKTLKVLARIYVVFDFRVYKFRRESEWTELSVPIMPVNK